MGELASELELSSDAARTAAEITAALASGDAQKGHSAFRRFVLLNQILAAEEGVARINRTLTEPAPTGSAQWDAAIAALCEYRLNADSLAIPYWVSTRQGNPRVPWVPPFSRYNSPVDVSKVPAEFLRRGILIQASTLEIV